MAIKFFDEIIRNYEKNGYESVPENCICDQSFDELIRKDFYSQMESWKNINYVNISQCASFCELPKNEISNFNISEIIFKQTKLISDILNKPISFESSNRICNIITESLMGDTFSNLWQIAREHSTEKKEDEPNGYSANNELTEAA